MTRLCVSLTLIVLLPSCNVPTGKPRVEKAAEPAIKPADESRRFPSKDRTKIELVDNNLLGKDFLPGGNLAEYSRDGKTYQQFLLQAKDAEAAALLMFRYKNSIEDARYLAHMGGYFGQDGDRPVLVFQKGKYVAGIAGLSEEEADAVARDFAARLD